MKILIFTEIFDCGGIDTVIINLINSWPNSKDEFVIVANHNYPGLQVIEKNVNGRALRVEKHYTYIYSNFINYISSKSSLLMKLVRILSPIIKYLFLAHDVFALRRVIFKHKADAMIVINGGYPGGDSCRAAAICWSLFEGKRSIHNFHNLATKPRFVFLIQETIIDILLNLCTAKFITVSKASADSMKNRPCISDEKVGYIHNGIDVTKIKTGLQNTNIRSELGLSTKTPLCLMLGTYEPRKGHEFLLRSFKLVLKKVPSAHLVICGYGFPEEVTFVSDLVAKMELNEHIHLFNFRTDAMSFLPQADVLLVSSQAFESFGLTSVEAMVRKIPVVATNVGGVPEVVCNGDGGYCVSKDDSHAYSNRIIEFLLDERLRKEQGQKGAERVARMFTSKVMAEKYYALLQKVAVVE